MKNREFNKHTGRILEHFISANELEPDHAWRQHFEGMGYRYLRVIVQDVATGGQVSIPSAGASSIGDYSSESIIYTFCKPEGLADLKQRLLAAAELPEELMKDWKPAVEDDASTDGIVIHTAVPGERNAWGYLKRKRLGGRKTKDYQEYYRLWKASGFDNEVRRKLWEEYKKSCNAEDPRYARQRFYRNMRRYRQRERREADNM